MNKVLEIFVNELHIKDPRTGKGLSKNKRIKSMYEIITDKVYSYKFSHDDKIMAADLIKKILKENEK